LPVSILRRAVIRLQRQDARQAAHALVAVSGNTRQPHPGKRLPGVCRDHFFE